MSRRRIAVVTTVVLSSALLTGCPFFGFATVGGSLTGLASGASITLQNNGADDLTLSQNGRFTFSRTLDAEDDYNVTVLTQPIGQNCTVTNASGTINSRASDVENVQVSCTAVGSIRGTVTGLATGTAVTLRLTLPSGNSTLAVNADGAFAFPGILSNGTTWSVAIATNPAGQTCEIAAGTGSGTYNTSGTQPDVTVTCS